MAGSALVGASCLAAPGEPVRFEPEVREELAYATNVLYVAGNEPAGDVFGRFTLILPLRSDRRRGYWEVIYAPSVVLYRSARALNHFEHDLRAAAGVSIGPRTALTFGINYEISQTQGRPESTATADLFLVSASERRLGWAGVVLRSEFRRHWSYRIGVGGMTQTYNTLGSAEPGASLPPEGLRQVEVRSDVIGDMARGASLGVSLRIRRDQLQFSGSEVVALLGIVGKKELGRDLTLSADVGAFGREPNAASPSTSVGTRSGVAAHLRLRQEFHDLAFAADLLHGPSAGGALSGTSVDTALALGLSSERPVRWRWSANARLARRVPTAAGEPLMGAGWFGAVEWMPPGTIGVAMSAELVTQQGASTGRTSNATVRIGLNWRPREARR